jgi:hypothetical protein
MQLGTRIGGRSYKIVERIARFERTGRVAVIRGSIGNTATLVTPTVRFAVPNYFTTDNER